MAKKIVITKELIESNLPTPPDGYSYRVEQFSKLVHRVMLVNHGTFSYKEDGEEIASVHCFIKSTGDVLKPKNRDKISTTKVCTIHELQNANPFSIINDTHNVSSLQHL